MTTATKHGGAAVPDDLALRRARVHLADSAEALAVACRNHQTSPDELATAEGRVALAFAQYGGLMLLARR